MSELAENVKEAIEHAEHGHQHHSKSSLNGLVAVSVAVIATFIALCNVKAGNIKQSMSQAQAKSVDAWAYFQAKGTKLNIVESARDGLAMQMAIGASMTPAARELVEKKIADYEKKIQAYERD